MLALNDRFLVLYSLHSNDESDICFLIYSIKLLILISELYMFSMTHMTDLLLSPFP